MDFNVVIEWEGHGVRVQGEYDSFVPAVRGRPEDSYPAEGGMTDLLRSRLLNQKGDEIDLPDTLQEALDEAMVDKSMVQKINEAIQDARED